MDYKNIEWISVQDAIPEPDREVYYKAKSVLKHEDDLYTPCVINFVTHDTVVTHWAYVPEVLGTCPECKGSGLFRGDGGYEDCPHCKGIGSVNNG